MKHIFRASVRCGAAWIFLILVGFGIFQVMMEARILSSIEILASGPTMENMINVIWLVVVTGILTSIGRGFRIYRHYLFTELNNSVTDKLLDMDPSVFLELNPGRVATVAESLWQLTGLIDMIFNMLRSFIMVVINLYMIITVTTSQNRLMAVVAVVLAAALWWVNYLWAKYDREAHKIRSTRNIEMDEIVNGFAEVRSFEGTIEAHRRSIHQQNANMMGILHKRNWSSVLMNFIISGGDVAVTIGLLLWGMDAIRSGIIASAMLVTVLMYLWRLEDPFLNLILNWSDISDAMAKLPDFNLIMGYENKINDGKICMDQFESSIEFKDVSFGYDKLSEILTHINLTIPKGKKIGICGKSGNGKTTLLNLLTRFYDVNSGAILIDGIDIRDYTRSSMKKFIGVVHQETFIFQGTIRDNVAYALKPNVVPEEKIIEACKKAGLLDFVNSLKDGLDTVVGNRGLKLSGGQRQRIALARLFLADPQIVILDEATSSLDNVTEKIVQDAIRLFQDKTVITVAHRLSTIKDSDEIYVLGNHHVQEFGTHEELMELNGIYAEMVAAAQKG